MAGFRRRPPDPRAMADWLAATVELVDDWRVEVPKLWSSWLACAERDGVEAGTPRSFANALRKLGFEVVQPDWPTRRTKHAIGLRLPDDHGDDLGKRPSRKVALALEELQRQREWDRQRDRDRQYEEEQRWLAAERRSGQPSIIETTWLTSDNDPDGLIP